MCTPNNQCRFRLFSLSLIFVEINTSLTCTDGWSRRHEGFLLCEKCFGVLGSCTFDENLKEWDKNEFVPISSGKCDNGWFGKGWFCERLCYFIEGIETMDGHGEVGKQMNINED